MSDPRGPDQPHLPPQPPTAPLGGWAPPGGGPQGQYLTRFCHACGAQVDPRAEICPRCGVRQAAAGPGKDRLLAAALALLLGGLGIHKFYLGKTALGVLYLVFCWTGIPSLIAWIEAITYLTRSNESWAAEYGGPPQRPNAAGIGCMWLIALWPALLIAALVMFTVLGSQANSILSRTGGALPVAPPIVRPQASPPGGTLPPPTPIVRTQEPSAPAIDQALVASLMAKIQANPNDVTSLLALANEYYAGEQFDVSAQWLDKVLAIDPKNIDALLARGAVSFNLGDLTAAQTTWQKVVAIDPNNVEVHYDLGFLYLNQPSPNWTGVQTEWNKVIALDPTSSLAKTVQSHLDSLAAASLLP
jgi:TM2 domain-containing membrane protein YozV